MEIKELTVNNLKDIVPLAKELNPELSLDVIQNRLENMFGFDNYKCFGLMKDGQLIGISGGWVTVRIYSGKQLEVDNVIIDKAHQSKGYGSVFFDHIEQWAKENNCNSVELNAYAHNHRGHKFYYTRDYAIYGYHFIKKLSRT